MAEKGIFSSFENLGHSLMDIALGLGIIAAGAVIVRDLFSTKKKPKRR